MPARQRFGLDEQPAPGWTGQQPRESGQHRPVGPADLWPGRLVSQHPSCRNNGSSASLATVLLASRASQLTIWQKSRYRQQSQGHALIIADQWLPGRTRSSARMTEVLAPSRLHRVGGRER
jgi:hypothetical protein